MNISILDKMKDMVRSVMAKALSLRTIVLAAFVVCCFVNTSWAYTTITSKPAGGNWSNTNTWVGGVVPNSSSYFAVIAGTVVDDVSYTIAGLTVNSSQTLTISPSITLTVNTPNVCCQYQSVVVNGTLAVNGTLNAGNVNPLSGDEMDIYGAVTMGSGAIINVSAGYGTGTSAIGGTGTLNGTNSNNVIQINNGGGPGYKAITGVTGTFNGTIKVNCGIDIYNSLTTNQATLSVIGSFNYAEIQATCYFYAVTLINGTGANQVWLTGGDLHVYNIDGGGTASQNYFVWNSYGIYCLYINGNMTNIGGGTTSSGIIYTFFRPNNYVNVYYCSGLDTYTGWTTVNQTVYTAVDNYPMTYYKLRIRANGNTVTIGNDMAILSPYQVNIGDSITSAAGSMYIFASSSGGTVTTSGGFYGPSYSICINSNTSSSLTIGKDDAGGNQNAFTLNLYHRIIYATSAGIAATGGAFNVGTSNGTNINVYYENTTDPAIKGFNSPTFPSSSTVTYYGQTSGTTLGAIPATYYNMTLNRSNSSSDKVELTSNIGVANTLTMNAGTYGGTLDVEGNSIALGTTGNVSGESNTQRIMCTGCAAGATDGKITSSGNSLAASTVYTGLRGIGLSITTGTTAPGSTTINRGFRSRSGQELSGSILRYYEVTPTTNSTLNATVTINYWPNELNGLTESTLQTFAAALTTDVWYKQGGTENTGTHSISLSGVNSFATLTAGGQACTTPTISSNTPTSPTTCLGTNGIIVLSGTMAANTTYAVTYNKNGTPVSSANYTSDGSGNLDITGLSSAAYSNFVATISTCPSSAYPVSPGTITLSDPPTPTISGVTSACFASGATTATLGYSSITGGPNQDSITWNSAALTAGFVNASYASFPAISFSVPSGATGPYNGTLLVRNSITNCVSSSSSFTATVIPTITGSTGASICGSGSVSLGATASIGTINWWAGNTSGSSLATGTSFTTPSNSGTTNYYVDATLGGCTTTSRTAVTETVNPIPTIVSTTPGSNCGTGTVALGATASAGTVNWYSAATGGSSIATGTTFTTPSLSSTTTYYTDATASGCTTGSRTAVTATINATPVVSSYTSSSPASCEGVITLQGLMANTQYSLTYYLNSSLVNAGNITTTPSGQLIISSLASGNYNNIQVTLNGCQSVAVPSSGVITIN